jgi:peptidoglycan hydrolase-like protein with peptidoglycan-binding domain
LIWDPRREAVIFLQERLNVFFGTWALKVDGNFGMQVLTTAPFPPFPTGTRALMVDGNFGMQVLTTAPFPPFPTGTRALMVDGNFGMQVLTTAPFPPFPTGTRALKVDGNFGPLTQQAVELFQIKCGLRADGTVGLMMTSDCIPHQVWPPRRWNRWADDDL